MNQKIFYGQLVFQFLYFPDAKRLTFQIPKVKITRRNRTLANASQNAFYLILESQKQ